MIESIFSVFTTFFKARTAYRIYMVKKIDLLDSRIDKMESNLASISAKMDFFEAICREHIGNMRK